MRVPPLAILVIVLTSPVFGGDVHFPTGAKTGKIAIVTPGGTVTSFGTFRVLPYEVSSRNNWEGESAPVVL